MVHKQSQLLISHFIMFVTNSLRAEIETDLSRVHPDPGALRLEARTRFLNRVISAVDTALSKYETVCVPSSTTFGRVRVGQTVCLACDRPFKEKKVRRSLEEEKLGNKENTGEYNLSFIVCT